MNAPLQSRTVTPSEHRRAIAWLVVATMFWGISFPVVKSLTLLLGQLVPGSGNWFITAMSAAPRFLIATVVVVAVTRGHAVRNLQRNEWRQGLLLGLYMCLGLLLQVDGLQFTSASVSAFLTQFSAIMIPAVVAVRTRRWPAARVWLCAGMVLAGVAVLAQFDWRTLHLGRGEASTLLGAVFFMLLIFTLDDPRHAGNRAIPVTVVMFATSGLLFTLLALGAAPRAVDFLVPWTSGPWLGLTLILTAFCTLGAFTLMNQWQPKITATEAGLIYCLEPVFASVLALFLPALFAGWAGFDYPNETVTVTLLIGGGLITLANVLLQVKPPAKREPEPIKG